jgi:hypothetical protein
MFSSLRRRESRRPARTFRPTLEPLEDRFAPAVFNVNSLADLSIMGGVNPDGTIIGQGNTVTLRSAIQAANATGAGGNTINLTLPGTYKITQVGAAGETDNLKGEFSIFPTSPNANLTIVNASGGAVTVDGNHLDRVFDINPGNTNNPATKITVTMQGFTITGGVAADAANPDGATSSGGGVRDQGNANLTLTDMVVTGNSATADGGGVAMENAPASTPWTLTVNSSTISDNHAGDAGGGLESDGTGKVFVTGGQFTGNTCLNQGAAVWLDAIGTGSAALTLTGTSPSAIAPSSTTRPARPAAASATRTTWGR